MRLSMVIPFILKMLLIINLINCSQFQIIEYNIEIPEKKEIKERVPHLLCGISLVDITPPPGMPLAGYSRNALSSKGFRHKLKSRIFILTNKKNHSIVFVQMDLLSGSKLLHHKIAENIMKKYPIGFSDIVIAGTHTHAGPGNYFESNFYNDYASNKPGLEPDYFQFLVQQITKGIENAWKERQPVKIISGRKQIFDYTKNRSFEAYLKNKNIDKNITKERAINPWVEMIRIDSMDNKPLGAITNFSIHPTVIPENNIFYNADVFGYIEKGLEDLVKKNYNTKNFIHGALNYTHGDITPNYNDTKENGDFLIAKEIGNGIAKEMFLLFQSLDNKTFFDDVELNSYSMEINLLENNKLGDIEICNYAVVGMALTTGATTRSTPILKYLPFFRPGWPRWFFTNGCQGEKRWFLSKLQHWILPIEEFPYLLYFQAVQIGNNIYLPYPFEITSESGKIIQEHIKKKFNNYNVIPVSCANGYTGYVTTPEEYSIQYYEGGHTLYGKNTALFLAKVGEILTQHLFEQKVNNYKKEYYFKLRTKKYYPEKPEITLKERKLEKELAFVNGNKESYWYFQYWDVPLYFINFHEPLISLEISKNCKEDFKIFLTDESLDISMHYIKNKKDKTLYEVRWYIDNKYIPQLKNHCYRFLIQKRNGLEEFYSNIIRWQ